MRPGKKNRNGNLNAFVEDVVWWEGKEKSSRESISLVSSRLIQKLREV